MVGGRRLQLSALSANGSKDHSGHDGRKPHENGWYRDDIETGTRSPGQRFRDTVNQTIVKNRSNELKRKLLDGIDRDALERFRKSDKEVLNPYSGIPRVYV